MENEERQSLVMGHKKSNPPFTACLVPPLEEKYKSTRVWDGVQEKLSRRVAM